MKSGFTNTPVGESMVTEQHTFAGCPDADTALSRPSYHIDCVDLLCISCGWQGHAHFPAASWAVFQTHKCKLRAYSISSGD